MPVLFGAGATWAGITGASATTTDIPMGAARKASWGATAGSATATAGSNEFFNSSSGPQVNAKTGNSFLVSVNASEVLRGTGSGLDFTNSNKGIFYGSAGSITNASRHDVGNASGVQRNVPTGLSHLFSVNGTSYLTVGSTAITAACNIVTNSGIGVLTYGAVFQNNSGPLSGYAENAYAQIYRNGVDLYINTANAIDFRIAGVSYMNINGNGEFLAQRQKLPTGSPTSSAYAGIQAQILYDSNYIYICVAANTWKRVAIASF